MMTDVGFVGASLELLTCRSLNDFKIFLSLVFSSVTMMHLAVVSFVLFLLGSHSLS